MVSGRSIAGWCSFVALRLCLLFGLMLSARKLSCVRSTLVASQVNSASTLYEAPLAWEGLKGLNLSPEILAIHYYPVGWVVRSGPLFFGRATFWWVFVSGSRWVLSAHVRGGALKKVGFDPITCEDDFKEREVVTNISSGQSRQGAMQNQEILKSYFCAREHGFAWNSKCGACVASTLCWQHVHGICRIA